VVQAGDAARRKLERDLHDGAQSRLVALALTLRCARNRAGGDPELADLLDRAQDELKTKAARAGGERGVLRGLGGARQRREVRAGDPCFGDGAVRDGP
jgi:hypothetical protein